MFKVDQFCKLDEILYMIAMASDSYLSYLPILEQQHEKRVLNDFRDRLQIMDERRTIQLDAMIKLVMGKVHFAKIMLLHDHHEIREISMKHKLDLLKDQMDH